MFNRKWLIVVAMAALLIAGGGVALGIWLFRDGFETKVDADARTVAKDADAVSGDLTRQDQPIFYAFDPPIMVNIKDTDAVLQVSVSVSTHYASVNDALKNDDPALRSAILLALSDVREDLAMTDAGKQQLLTGVVSAVNAQLHKDGYTPGVDSAYFTDFVIQSENGNDAS